ncbi:DUF748 domain-containing protein [Shewanella frigidimarina]|uniref:DUF748 domain-containing protein n=1 Tax=Shewanella frigidimarina (strain NCIMB 400) TaxID=318167 RepID=Q083W9_SHEFN|nr:DUF748 domain-containing protein [Shewanella frigidimarina]ABI71446.1 protein of unknown function DUF748 [Shewanella frigidimarina NCIMB 400]
MNSFFAQLRSAVTPRSRILKLALYGFTVYLLGCAVLGGLIPYIAKQQAPTILTEQLGRNVTLQDISINPFTLELTVSGFAINELDSPKTFASFATAYGNIQLWQSITSWAVVIEDIRLQQPTFRVARSETANQHFVFNFSDIITRLSQNTQPAPTSTEPTIIPAINIANIQIQQGVFTLDDNVTDTHINYPNINVSLAQFNSLSSALNDKQDQVNRYNLRIEDQFKGSVALQGQFQLAPLAIKGDVKLTGIDLSRYWSFVDQLFAINLAEGTLSLNGQYAVTLQDKNLAPISHINVTKAQIVINHFKALHQQDEKIAIDVLALNNIDLDSHKKRVSIGEFQTEKGNIKLNITPTGADLVALLLPKDTELTTTVDTSDLSSTASTTTESAIIDTTDSETANSDDPKADSTDVADTITDKAIETVKKVTTELKTKAASDATEKTDTDAEPLLAQQSPPSATQDATKEATAESGSQITQQNTAIAADSIEADSPWLVTLDKISIAQYQVKLGEGIASDKIILWQIGPIDFTTGVIKSDLSSPIDYQFSAGINQQSLLTSTGQVDALAQTVNAEIDFSNMLLSRLQPYIAPYINITIEDGMFSTKGILHADAKDTLTYSGSANISQLHINDNVLKQPLLTWQTMDINQLSFDRQQANIDIDEINVDKLFSRLIISPDRSTNISELINTPADIKQTTASVETDKAAVSPSKADQATLSAGNQQSVDAPQMKLNINKIGFTDSSAFFADNSLTPNFASGIEMLNGQITNLSSNPETTASVDLAGKIDKYAPVTLKGDVNPLLAQPYLDLNLNFDKVELTSVNPYSGTYAGYYIDKGQLSLDLTYQLKNNELVGSNHVVIDQLELGKRSNSSLATSLPVTLAIALLQDRHGVIDLGVDVSGDIDSPSFSFGSIIINALGNIITKAVTSPFSFLAGLVDSDEQIDKISFEYGRSNISLKQKSTLDKLAKALIDRPLLNLNIKGSVDLINDKQALAETKLHKQLANTAGIKFKDFPKSISASKYPATGPLADALYQLVEQELSQDPLDIKQKLQQKKPKLTEAELITRWHIGLYNMLKNHQQFTADEFGLLAQKRAKAVKAYLIAQTEIDPGKIFVLESRINTAEDAAEALLELQVK